MLRAGINTMATVGLVALLYSNAVTAEEWAPNLSSDTGNSEIKIRGDDYGIRSFGSPFRIKSIESHKNAYPGEAKVAGAKDPGPAVRPGKLSWGFNGKGAEIKLRF